MYERPAPPAKFSRAFLASAYDPFVSPARQQISARFVLQDTDRKIGGRPVRPGGREGVFVCYVAAPPLGGWSYSVIPHLVAIRARYRSSGRGPIGFGSPVILRSRCDVRYPHALQRHELKPARGPPGRTH